MIVNAIDSTIDTKAKIKKHDNQVSFTANNDKRTKKSLNTVSHIITSKEQRNYLRLLKLLDTPAVEQFADAHQLARKYVIYKNPNLKIGAITQDHFYLAFLRQMYGFVKDVKEGKKSVETEARLSSPTVLSEATTPYIWEIENTDKVLKFIKEEIKRKTQDLKQKSTPNGFVSSLEIENELSKNITYITNLAIRTGNIKANQLTINDAMIFSTMQTYGNQDVKNFIHNLSMAVMTKAPENDDVNLSYYDKLSKKLIENMDKNYNSYVSYSSEDESTLKYFTNNLMAAIEKDKSFENCKNLNKDNVDMVVFKNSANLATINKAIKELGKQQDKHHIVVIEAFNEAVQNSRTSVASDGAPLIPNVHIENLFKYRPKNVHLIFIDDRDNYYNVISAEAFEKELKDFQSEQIPIMDTAAAKQQLIETKEKIGQELNMEFDDEAIDFACEVCASQKGSKYDNALRLLKNAALYYGSDEKVLTKDLLSQYWQNVKKEDLASKDGSYDFIFDTKMTTDDIIGSKMVREQAKNVVFEIQNFPQTKGYVIYNSEGYGGGRFNCAKAIAGEAKIPMVTINAADFAIRDLDTINSDPMEAIDVKISKLMTMVKSQAQANPNKTAMLFISNFDRFGSDPLYGISSLYEQQAFKKLVIEMKKAQADKSYNIVVMGSSDLPEAINENIVRPGLFMDDIVIYPTQTKQNVIDIALHYAEKYGLKFEGGGKESDTVKHLATLLKGDPYIVITDIINKANIISKKQGKDEITIEDINEAYLYTLEGPTNEIVADDKHKEVIIRHEGGHALNLQFMYNLFKENKDTLRIPDSVYNIALDPRGNFLGCVFHDDSDENTIETNLETVFSNIVCAFGGNSVEQHFYGMEGSVGILQDRRNANYFAKLGILHMGLGKNTGHYIPDIDYSSGAPIFMDDMDASEYAHDIKIMLKNAKCLSDKIVKCYEGFLKEFSQKNLKNFATGKCIITGTQFANELKQWEKRQSIEKKKEIYALKKEALRIVEFTRESERYKGLNKFNPKFRTY